jgi:hypothetical protein
MGAQTDIGHERKFETMVFKAKKADCECCIWAADVSKEQPWFGGYGDSKKAHKGHYDICNQVAAEAQP